MKISNFSSPWLGFPHGYLSDWMTQRWVQFTGRYINLEKETWLSGPMGKPAKIGKRFFHELADEASLEIDASSPERGLIRDFHVLSSPIFNSTSVEANIIDFYEHTSRYDLDAWAEWCGMFRPFGSLIALVFSRRLQQLNVPLSALDTSNGITSDIIQLVDKVTREVCYTAWVRELKGSGDVLYAGSYSLCLMPQYIGHCVKVVFPLPNGNAIVIMKPEVHPDGSFSLTSAGREFGEPGFYFVVRNANGSTSSRYVRALHEVIRVYAAEDAGVRADHVLKLWGMTFLRLHYRLRKKAAPSPME
jgi:hypothetical protein